VLTDPARLTGAAAGSPPKADWPTGSLPSAHPARDLIANVRHVSAEWPICLYYHPLSVDRTQPPDDPEWIGNCKFERFLEAMALNCCANESFRANWILCEPRPSA
jgi:hypothetical protein